MRESDIHRGTSWVVVKVTPPPVRRFNTCHSLYKLQTEGGSGNCAVLDDGSPNKALIDANDAPSGRISTVPCGSYGSHRRSGMFVKVPSSQRYRDSDAEARRGDTGRTSIATAIPINAMTGIWHLMVKE